MAFGITQLVLPVRCLASSRAFFADALGFAVLAAGDGFVELDGQGVGLRLEATSGTIAPHTLRLQTTDLEGSLEQLEHAGGRQLLAPAVVGARLEARLADPDGHCLVLWRPRRESELPEPPPLPTSRDWDAAAETLAAGLLARVPESFRDLARAGMTAEAELLCPLDQAVSCHFVARAYIRSTPRLQRSRLHAALRDHGFAPEGFGEDFAC